ncbi:ATP-binding cassette domain-containing protein [Streptosporangium sp. NPDC000396]|uniref:ATP-binding cassette domain-containing protein n=1 Tax=Streptosporangium sp. NPDC000396 TaxID=3366185 RepID=UPI00367D0C71
MRLSRVSFRYAPRGPWVLKDVELTLHPGSVIEVTGRNGAGKSTLLRLLAGIFRPSRGSIIDRPRVVGYAPDVFPVDQPFTVTAYLTHMARIRGVSPTAFRELAGRLSATHLLDQPLGDLSKGSAQKVGLIQSLLAPPDLLILDEPFAGLDEQALTELPVIIGEVAADGGTVVVSDHQNQLRNFPGADHWLVADSTVTARTGSQAGNDAGSPIGGQAGNGTGKQSPQTVIEVIVNADEADQVEQKLRADGYTTRRTA